MRQLLFVLFALGFTGSALAADNLEGAPPPLLETIDPADELAPLDPPADAQPTKSSAERDSWRAAHPVMSATLGGGLGAALGLAMAIPMFVIPVLPFLVVPAMAAAGAWLMAPSHGLGAGLGAGAGIFVGAIGGFMVGAGAYRAGGKADGLTVLAGGLLGGLVGIVVGGAAGGAGGAAVQGIFVE